jgi:hypothetical protein
MLEYTELEIGLNKRDESNYTVDVRFSSPQRDDTRWVQSTKLSQFDNEFFNTLRLHSLDFHEYGRLLSEQLFCDQSIQTEFAQAFAASQALNMTMRIRLLIGSGSPELHHLRWETLHNPLSGEELLTSEQILFSRYLGSMDWRPVSLRPKSDLRALVVVANPSDVSDYAPGGETLASIDVEGEIERATKCLGQSISVTTLASGGLATLDTILTHLRDGYDILYLIAHGALIKGEPHIWLENNEGSANVVSGQDIVLGISDLKVRPRLTVLASCQSAGTGSDESSNVSGVLSALGPRMAETGIPSVLAMQGNVSMETVALFMPDFFAELQRDGQIDRAVAVARRRVLHRPDWWMPVLFMRLKSGRIWYVPGFGEDRKGFEKWPAIIRSIKRGTCTPIIGPRLTQSFEAPTDIAHKWSEQFSFPLSVGDRDELPRVAQYLSINQDQHFPRDELLEYLRRMILSNYGSNIGERLKDAPLDVLFAEVGVQRRQQDTADPYKILAELPFPVFITTNLSNLLDEALIAAGKHPHVELCRWNDDLDALPSIYDDDPNFRPDVQNPLVYYLFGRCNEPDSLVLTEDDYFDFLIGITRNKDLIPSVVRRALADTALLFLGFQLDEWDFRILFRSIMSQEGSSRRRRYAHVAAQIDPEDSRILQPERARDYLESYFQGSDISIFWGTVEDFINHLVENYRQSPSEKA